LESAPNKIWNEILILQAKYILLKLHQSKNIGNLPKNSFEATSFFYYMREVETIMPRLNSNEPQSIFDLANSAGKQIKDKEGGKFNISKLPHSASLGLCVFAYALKVSDWMY